jgi:hypothetical protein
MFYVKASLDWLLPKDSPSILSSREEEVIRRNFKRNR